MTESDIARFRQEQALQEQAAQQALYDLAFVADHASITARMQRGAEYLLTLLEEGKYEDVEHLMKTTAWATEETSYCTTANHSIQRELRTEGTSSI